MWGSWTPGPKGKWDFASSDERHSPGMMGFDTIKRRDGLASLDSTLKASHAPGQFREWSCTERLLARTDLSWHRRVGMCPDSALFHFQTSDSALPWSKQAHTHPHKHTKNNSQIWHTQNFQPASKSVSCSYQRHEWLQRFSTDTAVALLMFTILCHPGSEMFFQLNPGYTSLSMCERIQLKLMKAISLQVSGCSAPFVNPGNNTADLMEWEEAP